jgi:acetyl esterase/lipase
MASAEFQQVLDMVRQWADAAGASSDDIDLEALRSQMNQSMLPMPESATVTPVDAGGIPAAWVRDGDADPERRILYLHGGAYIAGGIESHQLLTAGISKATGASVLALDYRLAPEHPYPAAVEDAVTGYRYMRAHGPNGAGEAASTFIAGDSAGGGLTLATLLALRDAGDPLPDAAVTISAWSDLAATGDSLVSRAEIDPMINPAVLDSTVRLYTGEQDVRTPGISPLYGDYAGLPPLLMQVGDAEVLLDDTTRVAERAQAAGVDVTSEVWPEMFHVWHMFAPLFPEGQQAIDRIGEFIRAHG